MEEQREGLWLRVGGGLGFDGYDLFALFFGGPFAGFFSRANFGLKDFLFGFGGDCFRRLDGTLLTLVNGVDFTGLDKILFSKLFILKLSTK